MKYEYLITKNPKLFTNDNALIKIITDSGEIHEWEVNNFPHKINKIGVVYEDPYIMVLRDLVSFPDGRKGTYHRVINRADLSGGKSVVILPVFKQKIVLINHYRHATRQWHLEAPRGYGEPHISSEENALKELKEEINGEIEDITSLGSFHNNTGLEGVCSELFLAHLVSIGQPNTQEGILENRFFTVTQIEKMILESEITDGFTIAAFTKAKLRRII